MPTVQQSSLRISPCKPFLPIIFRSNIPLFVPRHKFSITFRPIFSFLFQSSRKFSNRVRNLSYKLSLSLSCAFRYVTLLRSPIVAQSRIRVYWQKRRTTRRREKRRSDWKRGLISSKIDVPVISPKPPSVVSAREDVTPSRHDERPLIAMCSTKPGIILWRFSPSEKRRNCGHERYVA